LGAFTVPANAQALAEQLRSLLAGPGSEALPADSRQVRVEFDGRLHRVLVGAYARRGAAQGSARQLKQFLDRETAIYQQH
jgi:cell division septation protein DedD